MLKCQASEANKQYAKISSFWMYVVFENNLVVSVLDLEEDLELTCSNIYLIYGLHCKSTKAKSQLRAL